MGGGTDTATGAQPTPAEGPGPHPPAEGVVSLDFENDAKLRESHAKAKTVRFDTIKDDSIRRQFANVEVGWPPLVTPLLPNPTRIVTRSPSWDLTRHLL